MELRVKGAGVAVIATVGLFAIVLGFLGLSSLWEDVPGATTVSVDQPSSRSLTLPPENTLGHQWRWENFPDRDNRAIATEDAEEESVEAVAFDVPYIYEALQSVRLDDAGNVVTDELTLKALRDAFAYQRLDLNSVQMEELKDLIRLGLPGLPGEQTADLVGRYHDFLQARKDFDALYTEPGMAASLEQQFADLQALRELYFGPEVSAKLFARENRDAHYMLASMQLARDESLSPDERVEKQQEIAERYEQIHPDKTREADGPNASDDERNP
ncbi:lipase secretion chaperone [Gilvimarinus sp. F26214L]|uniref:lipase secretion chaperone n=1 Tax=Gilvimarinus sp. DZF01 TaxID=3461371 RepID=UPI004045FA04